ncbi:MAG TPA: hypothetical protein VK533_04355 [Sphingomonas sp.]|uniref:hypothetical protein n=1 Tax=Sphingomonas sp. TaxID=28214 RepID=UPI002B9EB3F8|nr:hypothetical protein [Sphingomonas sp.]HMI18756.1 hypothetical protein [Sphingomonas sp.]
MAMIAKAALILLALAVPSQLSAQAMADMPGMQMPAQPTPPSAAQDMGTMDHDMAGMSGMLGTYAMTREASGTSWQPDSSPMDGLHLSAGPWMVMVHGFATLVQDDQGGPRGANKTFSQSMLMGMASRPVGDHGTLGLRAMVSLDPLMGKSGYPLLFATGETANGRDELVDRQHPHDFLMELSASYSHDLGQGRSLYLYGGLPGEPALGPPTFMHRISGMDDPEAPIGHHWFDSTHITFGVVTAGFSNGPWKIEASAFKGREPDQHRWDMESPKLDSWSVRGFWNPTANLSFQLSTGHIHSPEQLDPSKDEQRTTASVSYNLPLGKGGNWATTIAWARTDEQPGPVLTGWLGETSLRLKDRHILFARAEHVQEAELFDSGPLVGTIIPVSKLSAGYAYELPMGNGPVRLALGGLASAYAFPDRIKPTYGHEGVKSFMLFARLRLAGAKPGM